MKNGITPAAFPPHSPELLTPLEVFHENVQTILSQTTVPGVAGDKNANMQGLDFSSLEERDKGIPARYLKGVLANVRAARPSARVTGLIFLKAGIAHLYPGSDVGYILREKEFLLSLIPVGISAREVRIQAKYRTVTTSKQKSPQECVEREKITQRTLFLGSSSELTQRLRWASQLIGSTLLEKE